MTKPLEETWTAAQDELEHDGEGVSFWNVSNQAGEMVADTIGEPHAMLVAQAPAMARLLLDLHTEGHLTSTGSRECVDCSCTWRERITGKPYEPRHYDTCELATVLRAAGVLS